MPETAAPTFLFGKAQTRRLSYRGNPSLNIAVQSAGIPIERVFTKKPDPVAGLDKGDPSASVGKKCGRSRAGRPRLERCDSRVYRDDNCHDDASLRRCIADIPRQRHGRSIGGSEPLVQEASSVCFRRDRCARRATVGRDRAAGHVRPWSVDFAAGWNRSHFLCRCDIGLFIRMEADSDLRRFYHCTAVYDPHPGLALRRRN
jgi:hypothetical protein